MAKRKGFETDGTLSDGTTAGVQTHKGSTVAPAPPGATAALAVKAGPDGPEDAEVVRHVHVQPCLVEIERDAKGAPKWAVKLYGDANDLENMVDRVMDLDARLGARLRSGGTAGAATPVVTAEKVVAAPGAAKALAHKIAVEAGLAKPEPATKDVKATASGKASGGTAGKPSAPKKVQEEAPDELEEPAGDPFDDLEG